MAENPKKPNPSGISMWFIKDCLMMNSDVSFGHEEKTDQENHRYLLLGY